MVNFFWQDTMRSSVNKPFLEVVVTQRAPHTVSTVPESIRQCSLGAYCPVSCSCTTGKSFSWSTKDKTDEAELACACLAGRKQFN